MQSILHSLRYKVHLRYIGIIQNEYMYSCIEELSRDMFVWVKYGVANFQSKRIVFIMDFFLMYAFAWGGGGGCSVCVYYLELWCAPVCLLVNACIKRLIALYWFAGLVIDEKPDLKFVQSWVRANCKCSALSGSNSILCEVFCLANSECMGMLSVG